VLRALDLTKSYDGAPLFEGLSLTLNPGDRLRIETPGGYGSCDCAFPGNLENPEPASFWLTAPFAFALRARRFRHRRFAK
jgi:hypothetical protein